MAASDTPSHSRSPQGSRKRYPPDGGEPEVEVTPLSEEDKAFLRQSTLAVARKR